MVYSDYDRLGGVEPGVHNLYDVSSELGIESRRAVRLMLSHPAWVRVERNRWRKVSDEEYEERGWLTGAILTVLRMSDVIISGVAFAAIGGAAWMVQKYREAESSGATEPGPVPRGQVGRPTGLPGKGGAVTIEHPTEEGWFLHGILETYGVLDGAVIAALLSSPLKFRPPVNGEGERKEVKFPSSIIVLIGDGRARDVWMSQMPKIGVTAEEFAEKVHLGKTRSMGLFTEFS